MSTRSSMTPRSLALLAAMLAVSHAGCNWLNRSATGDMALGGVMQPEGAYPVQAAVYSTSPADLLAVRGQDCGELPPGAAVPRELQKITLQTYVIEPPDILLIDVIRAVPKAPYKVAPLDALQIVVEGTLEGQPIANIFAVDPGGMIQLGPAYGGVRVAGLTLPETREAIERHLRASLNDPRVSVSLTQAGGQQQIVGEHLVGLDGTVNLGTYGSVYVTGMTLADARQVIEQHLSQFLEDPKISLDIFSYNSKVYYVILEGGGQGDRVQRFPVTGNETVLDAISNIGGLTPFSSKAIWIARPAPAGMACDQVLPVNWKDVTRGGSTATNYQVLPGDRIFISENRLVALDASLERLTRPFERMFGFTALGAQTIQSLQRFPRGFNTGF